MQGLSPYLYGIHDRGGEQLLAGKGQVLVTESIGANPESLRGADYSDLAQQGLGVIVRLNHGYEPTGTIPHASRYADFAETCARFVAQSRGCVIWIIGNEPNHPVERPHGEPISPQDYAACFNLCYDAIKRVGSQHQVLPAAVGPWNAETKYPGNEVGDWVQYFADMLRHIRACDGLTLHAYTRGADPNQVHSEHRMDPPFAHRRYGFRAYQDFLAVVPQHMRRLPVLITEANEYDAWVDANTGAVQAIYREIDAWNRNGGQPIVAGILYRWLPHDRWSLQDKTGVHADLRAAVAQGLRAPETVAVGPLGEATESQVYVPLVAHDAGTTNRTGLMWDERLSQRFASLRPAENQDGGPYWKLIRAEWLDERQSQGRHHVFIDVLDAQGQRLAGVPVRFWWAGGQDVKPTEAKPAEEHAVDFAMYNPAPAYNVAIADGQPSDAVHGLGLGTIEHPHFNIHTSYRLVWQVTAAEDAQQTPKIRPGCCETTQPGVFAPDQEQTCSEGRYAVFGDISAEDWLITALARVLGVEARLARAFVQVESGGQGFVDGRLVIRFEAHLFRTFLKNDDWYAQHFRHHPTQPWREQMWRPSPGAEWQPVHVGGSMAQRQAAEWTVFEFAAAVNRDAALRSSSMGMAQVMGFNHGKVGYDSPEAMFDAYSASELNQLVGLFAYCHNKPGLIEAMQHKDWQRMAQLYNGSGQADYYASELQRIYQELGG